MPQISSSLQREVEWEKISALLDKGLCELDDRDCDAVALSFFEGRHFAEIATRLRISEEDARECVNRALEKLNSMLSRRRVKVTTAALGFALAGHASAKAPMGLAQSVITASLAAGRASTLLNPKLRKWFKLDRGCALRFAPARDGD